MQQEEKAVFILKKCSYEELQAIQHREDLLLSGWTLLEKEYMDVTEKVYGEDGTMVALINYYFLNENKDRMMIALRRWTKGYRIKQPNMDCQPTEITALMRHRAVFS